MGVAPIRKNGRTLVRSIRMNLPTLALMSALGLLLTACSRSDAPRLVWASEFGGGGTDDCDDVAVDESQLLLLACHSESNDFASVKREGSQTNAGMDAYVVKLDLSAGRLVWAVRLGGSKYDGAFRIHLDPGGAWVTGYTESPDFPTTPDALQNHFGGGQGDGLLARINSDGHLAYSTYFGGAGSDQTTDVVSDPRTGMIHLIGMTSSPELPGACNSRGGKEDAFLASFYSQQSESLRTFYLGGSEDEKPTALALHPEGQLALTAIPTPGTSRSVARFSPNCAARTTRFSFASILAAAKFCLRLSSVAAAKTPHGDWSSIRPAKFIFSGFLTPPTSPQRPERFKPGWPVVSTPSSRDSTPRPSASSIRPILAGRARTSAVWTERICRWTGREGCGLSA